MTQNSYYRAAEKFGDARRYLMLPFGHEEDELIAFALKESKLGIDTINIAKLDEQTFKMVAELKEIMVETGLDTEDSLEKAGALTVKQQAEVSMLIDDLANAFSRLYWSK